MAQVEGVIDPEWANEVAQKHIDIWTYNGIAGELIANDVPLRQLGGLAIQLSEKTYTPDDAESIAQRRRLINLAFEEDGRITLINELYLPAFKRSGSRDKFVDLLRMRMMTWPHEAWLFPVSAITVREAAEAHSSI